MNNKSSFEKKIVVQAKKIHTNLQKDPPKKHHLEKDKNNKYKSLSKNKIHKEKKSQIKKSASKFDLSSNKLNFNINQFQINKSKIKNTDLKCKKCSLQKPLLAMKPIKLNSTSNLDLYYSNNTEKHNPNIINMKINNSKQFNITNINIKKTSNNFFIGTNKYINNNIQNGNTQFYQNQKISNNNKYSKVIHPKYNNIISNMNNCFNNKKIFKKRYKITKINITTDNNNTSNSRNFKSSSYNNDIITDESKKETKNKNFSYNKSFVKQNNNKITNNLDNHSKSLFNIYKNEKDKKINSKKNNSYIIKNKNTAKKIIPQNTHLRGNSVSCSYPESYSLKDNTDDSVFSNPEIINLAKNEEKINNIEEKTERYLLILEKIIEKSQNPDTKFIFKFLKNEFTSINEEYLNQIKDYKETINKMSEKLSQTKKISIVIDDKIEENEKINSNGDYKMKISKNYDLDESKQNSNKNENEQLKKDMNEMMVIQKDNQFFFNLNKENLDDLDALYFLDKININVTGNKNNGFYLNNKYKDNDNKMNNYLSNNGDIIPLINLDPDYMESCKKKELKKLEEKHLTQFQRIALQFEPS